MSDQRLPTQILDLVERLTALQRTLEEESSIPEADRRILLSITNRALGAYLREEQLLRTGGVSAHSDRIRILIGLLKLDMADDLDRVELRRAVEDAHTGAAILDLDVVGSLQGFWLVERLIDQRICRSFEDGKDVR